MLSLVSFVPLVRSTSHGVSRHALRRSAAAQVALGDRKGTG